MLCPEVWDFKPTSSVLSIDSGCFEEKNCVGKINRFHFNHIVSVIAPGCQSFPKSLADVLNVDTDYYKVHKLDASELVKENFLAAFIRQGVLSALSIGTNIDTDNCLCVTPTGKLILSVNKETYQTLGLKGNLSQFSKRNEFKYIVNVDLKQVKHNTKEQRKLVERLKNLKFNIILNWEPETEEICPSSIAKYLTDLKYEVNVCKSKFETRCAFSVQVPDINFKEFDKHDCQEWIEWLGMFALQADIENGSADNYINTYEVPEPNETQSEVVHLQWRGFLTVKKLMDFFDALRDFAKRSGAPWIALNVQGFSDSVVSWGERENHFYTHSNNSYTALLNSEKYILCTEKMHYKYYNTK